MSDLHSRRYPIGEFEYGKTYSIEQTKKNIEFLADFPQKLKKVIRKASSLELDTPYRRGGWTVRQVVHHLADSHVNAYIRMKLAVTEIVPVVKPYEEDRWAELEDGREGPVKVSLSLLKAIHRRWVRFMSVLSADDLERAYYHPVLQMSIPLTEAIALYVWHSKHHLAHIRLVTDASNSKEEEKAGRKGGEKEKGGTRKDKKAKGTEGKKDHPRKKSHEAHEKRESPRSETAEGSVAQTAKHAPDDYQESASLTGHYEEGAHSNRPLTPEAKPAVQPKLTRTPEQRARMAEGRARAKAAKAAAAVSEGGAVPAPEAKPAVQPKLTRTPEQRARMAEGRARAKAAKLAAFSEAESATGAKDTSTAKQKSGKTGRVKQPKATKSAASAPNKAKPAAKTKRTEGVGKATKTSGNRTNARAESSGVAAKSPAKTKRTKGAAKAANTSKESTSALSTDNQ